MVEETGRGKMVEETGRGRLVAGDWSWETSEQMCGRLVVVVVEEAPHGRRDWLREHDGNTVEEIVRRRLAGRWARGLVAGVFA